MLAHTYNIITDRGVGSPGYFREVVDALNATDKRFILMITATVKLAGASYYDSHMAIHTSTANTYINLER